MTYRTKSTLAITATCAVAILAFIAVFLILSFTVFGAYTTDGLTLTGYVYGLSTNEGALATIASTIALLAVFIGGTTLADNI